MTAAGVGVLRRALTRAADVSRRCHHHRVLDVDGIGRAAPRARSSKVDSAQATDEMLMTEAPRSAAVRTAIASVVTSPIPRLEGVGRAELDAGLADTDQRHLGCDAGEPVAVAGAAPMMPPGCRGRRSPACRLRWRRSPPATTDGSRGCGCTRCRSRRPVDWPPGQPPNLLQINTITTMLHGFAGACVQRCRAGLLLDGRRGWCRACRCGQHAVVDRRGKPPANAGGARWAAATNARPMTATVSRPGASREAQFTHRRTVVAAHPSGAMAAAVANFRGRCDPAHTPARTPGL